MNVATSACQAIRVMPCQLVAAIVIVQAIGCHSAAVRFQPVNDTFIPIEDSVQPERGRGKRRHHHETPLIQASIPATMAAPLLRIRGVSAPYGVYPELELLAAELHTAFSQLGGVRLEEAALVADPTDPTDCQNNDLGQLQGRPQNSIAWPPATSSGASLCQPIPQSGFPDHRSALDLQVVIHDFSPYRPMRLSAGFLLTDPQTGHVLNQYQNVWQGDLSPRPFEEERLVRNQSLKHPATRPRLEIDSLPDISPRHLVKKAATEAAAFLHSQLYPPTMPIE